MPRQVLAPLEWRRDTFVSIHKFQKIDKLGVRCPSALDCVNSHMFSPELKSSKLCILSVSLSTPFCSYFYSPFSSWVSWLKNVTHIEPYSLGSITYINEEISPHRLLSHSRNLTLQCVLNTCSAIGKDVEVKEQEEGEHCSPHVHLHLSVHVWP